MARGAQAAIAVGVAVFGFDADPGVSPSRALQVLTVRRTLPRGELGARERFAEAAARVGAEAGVELAPRRGGRTDRLHLVAIDDDPGRGGRTVTAWYYATASLGALDGSGAWAAAKSLRLDVALHGGPEGSDRTFRRRIQELRDGGLLRPVADREVATLRARVPRFRSPAGTGGRPPELFRYAGTGGETEQLVALRARRSA